jgi:flagellar hook assembly protein FlgD
MDGYEDFAVISYNLTKPLSQIRIRIFDSQGRLVRKLADNIPSASNGTIIFDGFDDSGKPLKIGIYILLLEAINENSNVVETVKKAFVIARKL